MNALWFLQGLREPTGRPLGVVHTPVRRIEHIAEKHSARIVRAQVSKDSFGVRYPVMDVVDHKNAATRIHGWSEAIVAFVRTRFNNLDVEPSVPRLWRYYVC